MSCQSACTGRAAVFEDTAISTLYRMLPAICLLCILCGSVLAILVVGKGGHASKLPQYQDGFLPTECLFDADCGGSGQE